MLATYQQPGVVYAAGRPAPVIRGRAWLIDQLRDAGPVVAGLYESEVATLRQDPAMRVEVREEIEGVNLDKGRRLL